MNSTFEDVKLVNILSEFVGTDVASREVVPFLWTHRWLVCVSDKPTLLWTMHLGTRDWIPRMYVQEAQQAISTLIRDGDKLYGLSNGDFNQQAYSFALGQNSYKWETVEPAILVHDAGSKMVRRKFGREEFATMFESVVYSCSSDRKQTFKHDISYQKSLGRIQHNMVPFSATPVRLGDCLFYLGGIRNSQACDECYRVNLATAEVTRMANLRRARADCVACSANGDIYAVGGSYSLSLHHHYPDRIFCPAEELTMEKYDSEKNEWTLLTTKIPCSMTASAAL